jgi:hypothetical protein
MNLLPGPVLSGAGRHQGINMADRAGLGFVGFILGGITAAVMLVAVTLVIGRIDGSLAIDAAPIQIAANQITENQEVIADVLALKKWPH